ncbi:MAG: bifunctional methylenetetrahydrofolate dehydrogenase/methenyltetrahydrofolate cyclohydrolase FolD [Acidimicrobiia bacterium]|nr:bifunctional methylenetetrahydrofolate dehydrogenase/methenyltetrahydrofolate cyclohydrolase FolD [Acidimicrobiia bacterium]MXY75104.1 bifunctional methylenetetrahydrofolate dehydrogenase/methenyltetrahydrofolate cyclohydrolase FolD [Acidimicrobiia bacterium]MYA39985.1 bifunctional methylenetetrahydrofolate dehydrogenase/methenyltetrahydrofolate cyclohydrolase FolD [Acidimicrobiia bacterium]MYG92957.1 bifunctional methylenetetrahydrofolate dehydrogenase/methenyltetrahydrofolate cyclohydrolase
MLLKGVPAASAVMKEVVAGVADLARSGYVPGLATVLVGEDPASHTYVRAKRRDAAKVGIRSIHHQLEEIPSQEGLEDLVNGLSADPGVDGILVQLPLPEGLDEGRVVGCIDPRKDVDGLHNENLGRLVAELPGPRPCTPAGVMRILSHYDLPVSGKRAVVVGRSFLVGKPLALLLATKGADATVTIAHSRTVDLESLCREADILVAAVGRAKMVKRSWVKPGAVVVDVGINRTDEGLVGDVDFAEVSEVASAITPVPGGVGLMTRAMLMSNTLAAARGNIS